MWLLVTPRSYGYVNKLVFVGFFVNYGYRYDAISLLFVNGQSCYTEKDYYRAMLVAIVSCQLQLQLVMAM